MRIKTQLLISIITFSIILVIIGSSVALTQLEIAELNNQNTIVNDVQTGASDLNYISNNYFLYQDNSYVGLWQTKFSSLSGKLATLNSTNSQQQALVDTVGSDLEHLNTVFAGVISFLSNAPRNASVRVLPSFQTQWNRMAVQIQALAFDSQQLSQNIQDQTNQAIMINTILIIALLGLFGAFFITIYLVTYRGTVRSIAKLKNGISVIGSGNLDYTVEAGKNDEVADISKSVNQMATNLRTVTASKVDLEKEIAERKKAEEALTASEQKANDLIKYAPSGIYELDYHIPPKFRSVNDAMCQILGYTREELFAMSPFALLDDESKTRFRERIMKMLAGEKVDETVEFKVIAKNGRIIDAILNTTFTYKNGKPDGAMVVAHDVTELKNAERALEERAENLGFLVEERTKQLKDAERLAAIGATAGMVGHDIRNPLQAITSDLYLAKSDLASIPESEGKKNIKESLEEIEKNIFYVNKIVADLQDFAKPLAPKLEETDLEQTIHSALAHLVIPGNVTVKHSVRKDFPKLRIDQSYMQRILTNLANNAIQAMPNGGKLAINAVTKDGKALITVEDNGEGIPENVRSKLFTPLVTTKSKGQGFGLSVVKRFTEVLGGTVTFESEVGKGTKFIIELPL